jgi:hypothetical protein
MQRPFSQAIGGWGYPLLASLLMAVCGCGSTATVSGKVTYQGQPVTYGWVSFVSEDHTAKSDVIQPDGAYTVAGVRPGRVKIAVGSREPSKGRGKSSPAQKAGDSNPTSTGWFPIPRKYEDPEQAGLDCNIESGHVNHDIELK